ncbi:MAG: hypothetical protein NC122_07410, partial [Faecalibacterium sp.]|nr:hypothetical protein [Faecalibacterium sp.]
QVVARENSQVRAWGNSQVRAWENSQVVARENSQVVARENSQVRAWGNSQVEAWENSQVVARENSQVVARENSQVRAWGNSQVRARGNSQVVARENSQVVARENSQVRAWGNSQVEAWENSQVVAWENVQIVDYLASGKIQISGNARIVHNPQNIHDFMDFYGIKHTKTKAVFYKAVRKTSDGKYCADYDRSFIYEIGATIKEPNINTDVTETCGKGIHISHLNWALNYGGGWNDLAILEVETKIDDIVCPTNTDGKVRTSKVKVLREVPLEECGLYGNFLIKRRIKNET